MTSMTDSEGQNVSYGELLLERGYTGHEHLPRFGLINMNARLYEPLTARFLSPDPEVQAPDFSQNLNRYSYCLNNPLRYTDPTGMIYLDDETLYQAEEYEWLFYQRKDELQYELDKATDPKVQEELRGQIKELERSIHDLFLMKYDLRYTYAFDMALGPIVVPRTICFDNLVTMIIDPNTIGNFAHEIRHGGQLALGMYCIDGEYGSLGYCPKIEREAYQAQLAYAGELTFRYVIPGGLLYDQTYVNLSKIEDRLIPLITDKYGNRLYPFR